MVQVYHSPLPALLSRLTELRNVGVMCENHGIHVKCQIFIKRSYKAIFMDFVVNTRQDCVKIADLSRVETECFFASLPIFL
jgi:hypothetical protein